MPTKGVKIRLEVASAKPREAAELAVRLGEKLAILAVEAGVDLGQTSSLNAEWVSLADHDWYRPTELSGLRCRRCDLAGSLWSGEGCPDAD
jgi:hypothetical protein